MLGVLGKWTKVLGKISLCFMDMEPKTEFPSRLSTFFVLKLFFQNRFQILGAICVKRVCLQITLTLVPSPITMLSRSIGTHRKESSSGFLYSQKRKNFHRQRRAWVQCHWLAKKNLGPVSQRRRRCHPQRLAV